MEFCTLSDELAGTLSFAFLIFAVWFFWDGDTSWNDENRAYLVFTQNCNFLGICDIQEPQLLAKIKISVNKSQSSVIFFDTSGRIVRESKDCSIADKENFVCEQRRDEMVNDRFVRIDHVDVSSMTALQELTPAAWRLNWILSLFTRTAASDLKDILQ